jgi:XTP/dITP diphosphohydrolase
MKLLIASNNKHKIDEIRAEIGLNNIDIEIIIPSDLSVNIDPDEISETLEGNAKIKAIEFYKAAEIPVFADDTGLEVEALLGQPGVKSARFAGANCSYQDNCDKLLSEINGEINRNAQFRTVICFYDGNEEKYFEGICEGKITKNYFGKGGFGYDPIFSPDGYDVTFAQMSSEDKNRISHRGRAVRNFIEFLINK